MKYCLALLIIVGAVTASLSDSKCLEFQPHIATDDLKLDNNRILISLRSTGHRIPALPESCSVEDCFHERLWNSSYLLVYCPDEISAETKRTLFDHLRWKLASPVFREGTATTIYYLPDALSLWARPGTGDVLRNLVEKLEISGMLGIINLSPDSYIIIVDPERLEPLRLLDQLWNTELKCMLSEAALVWVHSVW